MNNREVKAELVDLLVRYQAYKKSDTSNEIDFNDFINWLRSTE